MNSFPRTIVGGVSLPRLVIGTNWFLGYSHTSPAKDRFLKEYQTRERISAVIRTFLDHDIDAVLGPLNDHLDAAVRDAEQQSGRKVIRIYTPGFDLVPGVHTGPNAGSPEKIFDRCAAVGATFCFPHQCVVDALIDRRAGVIRDWDRYAVLIRERGMIPGLSTHMPEAVVYADRAGADVETYLQLYNAAGFLMQMEADWVMKVIREAKKPVITIKPLAAGRLLPVVGLAFVWSTIRPVDLVTIGTSTPDEAKECIELSVELLAKRVPAPDLQTTRSKKTLSG
ncbi:MAG TPA: hypothetical protein ENN69_06680 [Spirochaetia bacterium]|nr:hypothetical protein [Spirochaetia bacterium]